MLYTEISGLTSRSIPSETIQVGDELRWEVEPKNSHGQEEVILPRCSV